MSWFNVWDGLKNKTCRYLLQRYLGQFLEEKLNLEQLKIELFSGKATVKNVSLNIDALNDLCESQGWALEVISGHIGEVNVTVPWNALMTKDSSIEVSDLNITVRPIKRKNTGSSMLESMWSSASSSIQMAEECMKQKDDYMDGTEAIPNAIIGLEKFAETIDNVLNRIDANFINTVLRLEYLHNDGSTAISLVTTINEIKYKNETGCEKTYEKNLKINSSDCNNAFTERSNLLPSFAKHKVKVNGIRIYTNEMNIGYGTIGSNTEKKWQTFCGGFDIEKQVPIVEIFDEQKIEIKLKQSEEVTGPKIYLSVELGSLYSFLTPRQIHLMLKLIGAFYDDPLNSTGDYNTILRSSSKSDLKKETVYLFGEHGTNMTGIIGNTEFKENDTSFILEKSAQMHETYCESTSSISSNSTITKTNKFQRALTNTYSCVDILDFSARINSFVGVFLHEDLVECHLNSKAHLSDKPELTILDVAKQYFSQLKNVYGDQKQDFSLLCDRNHLYLGLKPVYITGIQQRNKVTLLLKCLMTVAKIDFCEVLERSVTPLICFNQYEDICDEIKRKPELTIQFSSTTSCNLKQVATTSIEIDIRKCTVEFDISIYDRLSAYLCQSPFHNFNGNEILCQKDHGSHQSFCISILSKELYIKLRFPIVDMRPTHDRLPWWKQNIRPDFLLICFKKLSIAYKTDFIEVNSDELNAYYCESDISNKVRLLTAQSRSCEDVKKLNLPKISIHFKQRYKTKSVDALSERAEEKSGINHPFSSRKECRHSVTVHNVHDTQDNFENILLPGEREEVKQFCDKAMKNSDVSVHIYLPIAKAYIESKRVYEILYNRINSDLLMWEPTSPLFVTSQISSKPILESALGRSFVDSMYIPHGQSKDLYDVIDQGLDYKLYSSRSLYFSAYDSNTNGPTKKQIENKHNHFTLETVVDEGSLTLFVQVRDFSSHVLPGQLGKFDIKVNNLNISSVSGYDGNEDLGYVCIQLKNIEVYHCGLIPQDVQTLTNNCVEEEEYMKSIFYATPENLTKGNKNGIKEREMMSVAIEIKKNPKQRVKRLKVTTGVQKTTLRHYPAQSSHIWLNQLIDFFDVLDFPIEGFLPYGVITEIQLKLWDCAIDYRPKQLDYRAIIELGSFSMSSNIISSVSGCNLRFALEDCVLSIAPFDHIKSSYPECMARFISSENLVPVIEIGLFDISLRLKDDYSPIHPKLDLRFSIHDFHLRTCFDSFCALSRLITHIGNNGDISIHNDFELFSSNSNISTYPNSEIFSSQNKLEELEMENKQQERINVLMAEAVQEIGVSENSNTEENIKNYRDGIEVFYFPDENTKKNNVNDGLNRNEICDILNFESNVMLNSYYSKPPINDTLPQVKKDLGDINTKIDGEQQKLDEEGFCIISTNEENHIGIKNVEITCDPLRIVDNHFCLPTAKSDLLRTPENFPMPVFRYTLCEMTFTWHIYGGHDFPEGIKTTDQSINPTSECPKMSDAYKHGVSYSKCSKDMHFGKKRKEKLTWKTKGGSKRNQELLVEMQFTKIRFSHEEYPLHTSHASRQVVLINDIEIRDRLQISDIKKFLYHPNSKAVLNKNSRDMMVVKALHVRPNPKLCNEQECSLRISILPLRLNIDQNTLIFLSDFFANINEMSNSNENNKGNIETEYVEEPVMTMDETADIFPAKVVSTNLDLLMNNGKDDINGKTCGNASIQYKTVLPLPIYFREVVFSPELPICFDYHGHRIEFTRGPIVGLLMGLGQLECSEIRLKKITHRRGILGIDKLIKFLCKEWLTDIKKNQLSKILKGVGPTKAFKQLFDGIYDLFRLPFEQYQKDGRIIRGLQLGAQSFTARTALAALEITARIIQLLQFTAETAFDMVSPGPSVRQRRKTLKAKKRRSNRPKDIREGVANAYTIVKEGINDSANNLIETAVSEHDQKGYAGAVGAVMRQIPQLVVCPAVLATQATNNILGGVKSSLVPEAKVEAHEKWKDESD